MRELISISQMKIKTLNLGGNAIVGVDIDYAEVGGGNGMLMVCMAGTAVNLRNIDDVQPGVSAHLRVAQDANRRLMSFKKFEKAFSYS